MLSVVAHRSRRRQARGLTYDYWESKGHPVEPRSLYLAQLQDRLGPAAVANISRDAHRPTPDMTPLPANRQPPAHSNSSSDTREPADSE